MKTETPRWLTLSVVLGSLIALAGCGDASEEAESIAEQYDVLLLGGNVVDGTGSPAQVANIGIVGDRIVSVDASADAEAGTTIDATGLLVAPGFIDPHTHALGDLLDDEAKENAAFLMQGVTTVVVGNDGGGVPDFQASLETMRRQGIGTSVAFYAGHNDIRKMAMGLENRTAMAEELEAMKATVAEQMEAGALGLSTGLYYTPGSYSPTEEVIELSKVAARYGGVYDSHLRDESSYSIGVLGAVEEAIRIGEEAGLPVHIAHLKALGRDVWGQSGDIIALVEEARERGLDVTADQYPYRASGTSFSSALIPAWVRADSDEAMFDRIDNADLGEGIREEMAQNLWRRGGADSLLVTGTNSAYRGKTLDEIAAEMNVDPLEAAIEVVRGGNPSIASFNMNPDDIHAIAVQDWVMTGSDGSSGHPRKYASYPTVYRTMVLDEGWFSLERFVQRSSADVADALRICDRGYIEPGKVADIVLIDLDTYEPVADFQNPSELATGLRYALINGQLAVEDGFMTGNLVGSIVNRQALDCPD